MMDYEAAWRLQTRLVAARKTKQLGSDVIMILQHPQVFTLGRRGGRENLVVPEAFLQSRDIAVVPAERGGNITYHGPGQLVVYPIMDLAARRLAVDDFVTLLEEVMIRTADSWGVAAERNALNRGVWIGSSKLGSVGIAIRKGISFHGMALNISTDLEPFGWINPCGLHNVAVTSLEQASGLKISMDAAITQFKAHFQAAFALELVPVALEELAHVIREGGSGH
jgi:lipoate-protein ligase B